MASCFIPRPTIEVPEGVLPFIEQLCVAQSSQLFVTGNELEARFRDTWRWHRLHLVKHVSEIYSEFVNDPHFHLLGEYLVKRLSTCELPDFLRLFLNYLAPFKLSLPTQRYGYLLTPMEERNLRMFTEAFGTIYGHYSTTSVNHIVNTDIEPYLFNSAHVGDRIVFPYVGTTTYNALGQVVEFKPYPVWLGTWPNYAPMTTISLNL